MSCEGIFIADLDVAETIEKTKYSDVFKSLKIINLEDAEDVRIGNINKMVVHDSLIFVHDKYISKGLFVFNLKGDYLYRIGNMGNGPGEYISLSDFCIDPEGNKIYIIDDIKRIIISYKFPDGSYMYTFPVNSDNNTKSYNIAYAGTCMATDLYYYDDSPKNNLLRLVDKNTGREIGEFFSVKIYNKTFPNTFKVSNNPFNNISGKTYFNTEYMDIVSLIDNNEIRPYLHVYSKDFISKKNFKNLDLSPENETLNIDLEKLGVYCDIRLLFEHNNIIYFIIHKGIDFYQFCYNKQTGKTYLMEDFHDDFIPSNTDMWYPSPSFGYVTDEGMYNYLSSFNLEQIKIAVEHGLLSLPFDLKQYPEYLETERNPIIFYYEFKRFP